MPKCKTCGVQIEASARICPSCGALTGIDTRRRAPVDRSLSIGAALLVGFVVFLLLRWAEVL